jgi:hypothetical protein
LLAPLSQLGYQTLALEVPISEREAILAWAKGATNVVPGFFATPWLDGRGDIELLTLIRTAVSPPFQWQLICFDEFTEGPATDTPSQAELIAYEVKSDAVMAASLCDQYQRQKTKTSYPPVQHLQELARSHPEWQGQVEMMTVSVDEEPRRRPKSLRSENRI